MLRLLLASEDGYLYVYSLDVGEGGDCALIRQFHLSSKDVETTEAVKMEQQQLEATHSDQADQVDQGSNLDKKLTESKINLIDSCFFNYTFFLVDISYADRLKNRHPSDQMTGNNPSNFNFLQQKKNPLHFALLKGVGTAFSHYEKKIFCRGISMKRFKDLNKNPSDTSISFLFLPFQILKSSTRWRLPLNPHLNSAFF